MDRGTTQQISKTVQSEAIRAVSREMFEAVESYFPKGPDMHGVVASFGRLVRDILEQGSMQKKGQSSVPTECPRIEIDQPQGNVYSLLSAEQKTLARELN